MAILSSSEQFQIFELQRNVPELVVVADSFHTKPLLRALQSADRYQVLALKDEQLDETQFAAWVTQASQFSGQQMGAVNARCGVDFH